MARETFGEAVRRLRKERDISLCKLATKAPMDKGHLSKIENGKRPGTLALARALDNALGAGGELVAIAKAEQSKRVQAAVPFDPMKRRTLVRWGLTVSAAAGLGPGYSGLTLETLRHGLTLAAAEERASVALDEWQEIVWDYGYSYMTTPAAELLDTLTVDLLAIQSAVTRERDDTSGHELRRTAAALAAFTALTLGNLSHLTGARRWWRSARRVADQSGDRHTALWVRGHAIVRALYEERSPVAILASIEEAEALGGSTSSAGFPSVIAGKAQTLAVMNRSNEAEAALGQLQDIFADLPAEVTGDERSLLSWRETELRFTESFVHSHLGNMDKADEAQRQALRLYPAANVRGPAQIELLRALCMVHSGDSTGGARHAQAAVATLARSDHTRPVIGLGHRVLSAVSKADRQLPAVAELRDYLATPTTA